MTAPDISRQTADLPLAGRERHLFGVLLILGATIMWSTAGFFVRALDMDTWSIVAWRSLFASLSLAVLIFTLQGRAALRFRRSIGPGGAAAIPVMAMSMFSYVAALNMTSVANVMVIYATVPFLATGLAFLLLRERPTARALAASTLAFLGVAIMAASETGTSDLTGNGFAFLMTLGFAASVVIARRWPDYDAMSVTGIASAICALACFTVIWAGSLPASVPHLWQIGILFLFSLATQSLSFLFFLIGSRHVPSSEAGLIALLDVILGPLWVWLVFSEQPETPALIGGALVLLAVIAYLAVPGRRRRSLSGKAEKA
ncbi:DMT family transporter [Pseudomonas sp. R2.Fl]|nr:DMT family transporter [Pseudomonas sp. R2.Fl]